MNVEPLPPEAIIGVAIGLCLAVWFYGPILQAQFSRHTTEAQYHAARRRQGRGEMLMLIVVIFGVLALAGTFDGGFSLRELGASFGEIMTATRSHMR